MYIEINGSIIVDDNPVTGDELLDKFIDFVEANKWQFCGITSEAKTD